MNAPMKATKIYVLRDPRTNEIRYVGKTVKPLNDRLASHINDSKTKKSHRGRWIASLLKIGLSPIIEMIETCGDNWAERERFWIAHYRAATEKLTNECDGGEGAAGAIRSAEDRAKMAERQRQASQTEEWRARMVASSPEYWTPARRAERAAKVRSEMTAERRAAHSEKLKETMADPEWKARHSLAMKAKWTPELRATQAEKARISRESPGTMAKIKAAAQKRWTIEARAAASEKSRQAATPEARARNAEAQKARWTPEMRQEWRERTLAQHAARKAQMKGKEP